MQCPDEGQDILTNLIFKFQPFGLRNHLANMPLRVMSHQILVSFLDLIRLLMLCVCITWCLKESEMGILGRSERSIMITMRGVQVKDRESAKNFMLMLGVIKATGQLTMASGVWWGRKRAYRL